MSERRKPAPGHHRPGPRAPGRVGPQPARATELELTPEELAEIEDVQIEAQGER